MEVTMLKPYDLLEGVLNEIENGLKEYINDIILAEKFSLSPGHLRRLFKFAFGQPLGTYIRSRKLAASIEDLLLTDNNILDIVLEYGLDYEQSYNRTFKREFGITPGKLRRSGQAIKITPPLQLFDSNRFGDGLIFGPDIVMVPQFHVVGKTFGIPSGSSSAFVQSIAKDFFFYERQRIPEVVNHKVFYNICSYSYTSEYSWYFMPAFQVRTPDNVPEGFESYTFPTSLCANFHFIYDKFSFANFSFGDFNPDAVDMFRAADGMFKAIDDFISIENQKYFMDRRLSVNKFYYSEKSDNHLQLEWFSPVVKRKQSNG